MTFAGVVLLLLTATFQVQAYIQSTVLQPQFEIIPQQKSILSWRPPGNNSLQVIAENDQLPPDQWRVPLFSVKNTTPINAQDVRVRWSATRYDVAAVTANAPVLHDAQVTIENDSITLSRGGFPFRTDIGFSATIEKPFITRSSETFIPLSVWNTAAVFFLATLPAQPGARSEPYYFDLEIFWSIPENAKPARYRVKAVATNTKSSATGAAAFSATLTFPSSPELKNPAGHAVRRAIAGYPQAHLGPQWHHVAGLAGHPSSSGCTHL
jgi:hypothetical protein